jgi:hypothetical protein
MAGTKNKLMSDPRGDPIRIKVGKNAHHEAWKDLHKGETREQIYVVVYDAEKSVFVTGIRVNKSNVVPWKDPTTYEDVIVRDPKVYKTIRTCARAIAKCDIGPTKAIMDFLESEIKIMHLDCKRKGNWNGNIRDQKASYPLASAGNMESLN